MKKKRIILIVIIILAIAIVTFFGLYFARILPDAVNEKLDPIFGRKKENPSEYIPVDQQEDPAKPPVLDPYFADDVFPKDMIGVFVDLDYDVKTLPGATYGELYNEATLYFSDFRNYRINTVFLRPDVENRFSGFTDSYGNAVDILREYIRRADEQNLKKVLQLDSSLLFGKSGDLNAEQALYFVTNYAFDAVMLCPSDGTSAADVNKQVAFLKTALMPIGSNAPDVGVRLSTAVEAAYDDNAVSELMNHSTPDFVMLETGSIAAPVPFTKTMTRWNAIAVQFPNTRFFCEHRNDRVLSGATWSNASEIVEQMRLLWDYEGISGSAFRSAATLIQNKSSMSLVLSRFLFDGELSDLTVTDIRIDQNGVVFINGTSAAGHKLLLNGQMLSNGASFNVTKALNPGLNPFVFRNCSKTLQYDVYHNTPTAANRIGYTDPSSPYVDNGLGTAQMVRIKNDDVETLGSTEEKDTYHADYSTLPEGTIDYLTGMELSEAGFIRYNLKSGNTVYGVNCELIDNGFILPNNQLTLDKVDDSAPTHTDILLNTDWFVPVNLQCLPQSYHSGYDSYHFNISSFTAEYVDVTFHYTDTFLNSEGLVFSQSSPFSKGEIYTQGENLILRLYLKKVGQFYGYDVCRDAYGHLVLSFKKHSDGSLAGKTILLDAGHGGWYMTGTSLVNNSVAEKTVTLSIALKAKEMLESRGATVIMSRVLDTSFTLEERTEMIRLYNPDIFVSIHCDGTTNTSDAGTHSFYFRPYSMPLADCINQSLANVYKTYIYHPGDTNYSKIDKSIKYYPFFVTRMNQCPAVLVETGFMTNLVEGAILTNDNTQMWLAQGLTDGIANYFAQNH